MKYLILFTFFFCISLFAKALEHVGCALLAADVPAFNDPEKNSDAIMLKKGIILPVFESSDNGKYTRVLFYNKYVWIKKGKFRRGTVNLCSSQPKCFTLNQNAKLYSEPDTKSKAVSILKKNYPLDWFGQTKVAATDLEGQKDEVIKLSWYQVAIADRYAWVQAEKGTLDESSCQGSLFGEKNKWHFLIDAGLGNQVPQKNYESIITPVPDPNFVTCLQDPLYRSVSTGSSQRIGAQTAMDFTTWLTLRLGVFYEKIQYKLSFLNNPHPNPGAQNCNAISRSISDLSSGESTIFETNIVIPVGAFYKWEFNKNHSIFLGTSLNSLINIPPEFEYKFFTGQTLSKQTENVASIKINQFRVSNDIEIRYTYQLRYSLKDSLGFSAFGKRDFSGQVMLGFGLQL